MFKHHSIQLLSGIALLALVAAAGTTVQAANQIPPSSASVGRAALSSNATVWVSGLNNPRGLKFGADGNLYVAEGGTGGKDSTVGKCDQAAGVGPYTGSKTGSRISKIDASGKRTTVADNLPSSATTPQTGSFTSGVGDIAFVGDTLYAVLSGGGCSHGVPDVPNALLKVNADGTTTQVADLSAFLKANPVAHPESDDFEPDGTWYGLVAIGSDFYATEPNHQEVDKISSDGKVSRVIDLSTTYMPDAGWQGPTAMTVGPDGNLYMGTLGKFPAASHSKILKLTPGGQLTEVANGLTTVLGVAFDKGGQLYALETSAPVTQKGPPVAPGTGRVVRVKSDGTLEPVATGLTLPTGMVFGPDGTLYVSNKGFGLPPGNGEIVKVDTSVPIPAVVPTTGASVVWSFYLGLGLVGVLVLMGGIWVRRKFGAHS